MSESGGEVGLADIDRAEYEDAVAGLGEPQAGQVREERSVVGEVMRFVPGLEPHGRVQAGRPGAAW